MPTQIEDVPRPLLQIKELLERYDFAWRTSDVPPNPRAFLPADADASLIMFAATELIKVDMQHRLRSNDPWPLERYLEQFPEVNDNGKISFDLIYEEYYLRKIQGQDPDPKSYVRRFPKNEESLRRLLDCSDLNQSTSILDRLPAREFEVGQSIDEFTIQAKIGSGAFASVYLARQKSMQRTVALKVSAMRSNEPETLAQLDHPGIIRVYDQRYWQEGKLWLLYMQFVPGGTLKDVIHWVRQTPEFERDGRILLQSIDEGIQRSGLLAVESEEMRRRFRGMSWSEVVCRIGVQLFLALDYAHRQNVLHRDLKPANVLLTAEGTPKLADFNISFGSELEGVSPETFFGGTLAYMSPEQLDAYNTDCDTSVASLDKRSDLYSMAVVLWELLYGQRPFREDHLPPHKNKMLEQLACYRRTKMPIAPTANASPTEKHLVDTLLNVLAPDRESRPNDGASIARQLWLCLEPKSKSLIEIPAIGWRSLVRRYPMTAAILVGIVPNGLAGFFNFVYNRGEIEKSGEQVLQAFDRVSLCLNVFYFSLAAVLAWRIVGPLTNAVRQTSGTVMPSAMLSQLRLKCLRLGLVPSLVGTLLWISSGFAFPMSLQWLTEESGRNHYTHFLASMTVCGLIAAAYPFFGVTFLSVRVFFPALLKFAPGNEQDELQLDRLENQLSAFLFAAGAVPLASMLMVVLLQIENRFVSLSLVLSGLLGLAIVYFLYQKIRQDIATLRLVIRPVDVLDLDSVSYRKH